uniref:MRN complex-interacting protein N-terminal domain-containing protein n=1 Tax=Mastacembelus armatus TaxID=205130 RepID=A0A3Q3MFP9_9TELE
NPSLSLCSQPGCCYKTMHGILICPSWWSCKLCGEKQSLLKEFGCGSGPDCRQHVQKLNAMRGAMMEEKFKSIK